MKVKHLLASSAILGVLAGAKGDLCDQGRQEIDGNWYCQAVQAIQYSNVGSPGSYNQIVDMAADGTCSSTPKPFTGPLAPLDEEVSLHFRGPVHLKQLAVYGPSSTNTLKHKRHTSRLQRRGHLHQHQRVHNKGSSHKVEKRQEVSATIDGQVVSWQNNWFGDKVVSAPDASTSQVMVTATIDGQVVSWTNNYFGEYSAAPGVAPPTTPIVDPLATAGTEFVSAPAPAPIPTSAPASFQQLHDASATPSADTSGPNDFDRIGYYNAGNQTVDNLVFLGNYGGQGSGVFDLAFGASLSYANCDGTGGAASPQILADKVIPSDSEVIVMLDRECSGGSCGYVRPGAVAHHGFDGAEKIFLIEFSMPMDGENGFNADMPAIWMLNAQIPRTLQYGNAECSCWESGCGEFDIAEGLNTGSTFLKSTIHTNKPAGDSDYFERPTSSSMKLAVIFNPANSTIHLQVLPDETDFPEHMSADEIDGMCNSSPANAVSHFVVS